MQNQEIEKEVGDEIEKNIKELGEVSIKVSSCKGCTLFKTRKNPVFGIGKITSDIMFIGEAPGRNEDLQGLPFVGAAGKVLDELLQSIELKREDVYICNILKCRPPENRDPKNEEIKSCTPYLDRQIEIINPKIISTLGNFASKYIMEKFGINPGSISKIHGKVYSVSTLTLQTRIVPMYHPAVAVYNPNQKEMLGDDFKVLEGLLKKV